jgi:hypothetical protein
MSKVRLTKTVLRGVDDAVCEEDTDGDAELVSGDKSTSDLLWCNLGHVQDDNSRNESHSSTTDDPTGCHDANARRRSLQDTSNGEDQAAQNDGGTSTDEISNIACGDGTKKCSSGQNRGGERLLPGGQLKHICLVVCVCVTCGVSWELDGGILEAGILLDEVLHAQHARHPSCVITEEDAAKRSECTDQVGFDGDWGFDTSKISRARKGHRARNNSTRHDGGSASVLGGCIKRRYKSKAGRKQTRYSEGFALCLYTRISRAGWMQQS